MWISCIIVIGLTSHQVCILSIIIQTYKYSSKLKNFTWQFEIPMLLVFEHMTNVHIPQLYFSRDDCRSVKGAKTWQKYLNTVIVLFFSLSLSLALFSQFCSLCIDCPFCVDLLLCSFNTSMRSEFLECSTMFTINYEVCSP